LDIIAWIKEFDVGKAFLKGRHEDLRTIKEKAA
jgi:hypothetical protein